MNTLKELLYNGNQDRNFAALMINSSVQSFRFRNKHNLKISLTTINSYMSKRSVSARRVRSLQYVAFSGCPTLRIRVQVKDTVKYIDLIKIIEKVNYNFEELNKKLYICINKIIENENKKEDGRFKKRSNKLYQK